METGGLKAEREIDQGTPRERNAKRQLLQEPTVSFNAPKWLEKMEEKRSI